MVVGVLVFIDVVTLTTWQIVDPFFRVTSQGKPEVNKFVSFFVFFSMMFVCVCKCVLKTSLFLELLLSKLLVEGNKKI